MPASRAWRRLRAIVPLSTVALVAALMVGAPAATASQNGGHAQALPPIAARINQAANVAISHIGDPYRYGAAGPSAFDCSGLSMFSYDHSNLYLPRTAASQYAAVRHISPSQMIRGDLVFFHDSNGHVYHVGMFLYWNSEHRAVIIHAPYPGQRVHRAPVWTSSWYAGTRRPA